MGIRQRKILAALGSSDHRLHQGVVRYAREHGWLLSPQLIKGRTIPWGWKGDGILTWLGMGDELAEFVSRAKVPVVDFSHHRPDVKILRVIEDHAHSARLVAEHFLVRGFTRFLFYNRTNQWPGQQRGRAFVEILKRAGHECIYFQWHQPPPSRSCPEPQTNRLRSLAAYLKRSPMPLAVFAASDDQAVEVFEACEALGLRVPEDVAVAGGENCLLAPDTLRIPISCVDTNQEAIGYRGARLLDDLISGLQPPASPVQVPAAGLVVRRSSDVLAVNHEGVASCLRLIHNRLHERLTLDDLVKAVEVSPRTLHEQFVKHLGCTPGAALRNARIERAKRLLAEPVRHKLGVVAVACGYRSANSLCATFAKFVGTTPNSFRKNARR